MGRPRFIDLPDNIVHHILSFLPIQDLARLGAASTRFRKLCRSVPSLMIDNKNHRSEGLSNFVDRFLGLRCKVGLKMQRFCLHWSFGSLAEIYRLETWLCYALYSNIEELDLEIIPLYDRYHMAYITCALPLDVFRCKSLRSLKVNMSQGVFRLPALSSGFTALQSLSLKFVRIEQESFGQWIYSCSNSLRELSLQDLYGANTITITSSSLTDLRMNFTYSAICDIKISAPKLQSLKMRWFPNSSSSKSLKITAPNLTYFVWEGHTLNYQYCVPKFMHLEEALIFLTPPCPELRENKALTGLNMSEIFCSVSKAKNLHLTGQLVEVLFMRGCLPFALDDVRGLFINYFGCLNGTLVPAIASLLKGTPALEFLSILPILANYNASPSIQGTKLEEAGFNMEYWESQSLGFTDQLKSVAIKICGEEGQNELELLKYLLKHAKELKTMIVYSSLGYSLPLRIYTQLIQLKNSSDKVSLVHTKMGPGETISYD